MPDIVPYEPPPKNDRVYARVIPLEQLPPNFIYDHLCGDKLKHWHPINGIVAPEPPPPPKRGWLTWFKETFG